MEDDSRSDTSQRTALTGLLKRVYDAFVSLGVGKGVTLSELRAEMGVAAHEQQQLRRRIKDLRDRGYNAHRTNQRRDGEWLYVLEAEEPTLEAKHGHEISAKVRAEVMHRAGRRCQMCGKTPQEDGVKLVVDHRVPRDWGSLSSLSNANASEICGDLRGEET